MVRAVTSAIFIPPTLTAKASGLSLKPPQVGQARELI